MKKVLILLLIMTMLSACNSQENEVEITSAGKRYDIYFVQNNDFVPMDYFSETTDDSELIREFLGEMGLMGEESVQNMDVYAERSNVSNGVAYVYFNESYTKMDNIYEVLFRAAIVKTLVQLENIEYVYFYVDDKSLTYQNGQIVGLMSEEDFLTDSNRNLNSLAWTSLTLYFANETGNKLVTRKVDVAYDKSVSLEQLIVEQLIQGPSDNECKAVVPEQMKVLGINVSDGICYINLDLSFITKKLDVTYDVTLYSVVNSICELSNIYKVQFLVNGDSHIEANGHSFDVLYERNLDLIEQEVVNN